MHPSRKHVTLDCLTYSAKAVIDHLNSLKESTPEVIQLCFVTQLGPACDILCLQQVLRANDKYQFLAAMDKEIQDQYQSGQWDIIHRSTLPEGARVLPSVWAFRCKQCLSTQEVIKWKARLTLDRSRQHKGIE